MRDAAAAAAATTAAAAAAAATTAAAAVDAASFCMPTMLLLLLATIHSVDGGKGRVLGGGLARSQIECGTSARDEVLAVAAATAWCRPAPLASGINTRMRRNATLVMLSHFSCMLSQPSTN